MFPLVSIVIPVFNRSTLVVSAIESVLAQTYTKIQIVVVNDGSTDNTGTVLNEYQNKYPDIIFVIDQKNTGQVVARNNGIKVCRGELIAFLDSDDHWLPEKLEKQVPLFRRGVGLVYCGINEIDAEGNIINTVHCESGMRGRIFHHLVVKNRMTGGSVVVTKEAIDKIGYFDAQLKAAENWDLWIRLSKEYLVDYIDEPLVNYRKHDSNMSGDYLFMSEAAKSILEKHLPTIPHDPTLRKSYKEAYINYYLNLGLCYFAHSHYPKCREVLRRISNFGNLTPEIYILIFRTYLGVNINRYITSFMCRIRK